MTLASDPLVEVAVRMYAEFAGRGTLAEILVIIDGCRNDLDTPNAASIPEMVERLARQRLSGRNGFHGTAKGATSHDNDPEDHQ